MWRLVNIYLPDYLIVYGDNLDCYSILQAMMDCGIPPEKLLLACPGLVRSYTDPDVLRRLDEELTSAGVRMIGDVSLKEWEVEGDKLVGVVFRSSTNKVLEISCQALVYVDNKHVDVQAFDGITFVLIIINRSKVEIQVRTSVA